VERALFTKEVLGLEGSSQGTEASIPPPPTKSSKKRKVEEKPASDTKKRRGTK
jgi:hypothetical protein